MRIGLFRFAALQPMIALSSILFAAQCLPGENDCHDYDAGCAIPGALIYALRLESQPRFLYVVSQAAQTLSWLEIDSGGMLTPRGTISTGPGFFGICGDRAGKYLFLVAVGPTGPVVRYTVDGSGTPTARVDMTMAFGGNTQTCALDSSGEFVYVVTASATNNVFGFRNSVDGLVLLSGSPFSVAGSGADIKADPEGKLLFVRTATPDVAGLTIGAGGALTNINSQAVANMLGYAVSPRFVHASTTTNTVVTFALSSNGTLSATGLSIPTSGTLASSLAATLDGSAVFLSRQTTNEISSFLVQADGSLSLASELTCGNNSFPSVDNNGRYVFVTSLGGATACAYSRSASGVLSLTQTLPITGPTRNFILHRYALALP